ncbi:type II toxin-antitoxin system HicB family antitoxin [Mesorhizobium sp. KR2-14]|uniref:type II toxin-antitoxin system HicB family antitoxin n=1 Tax=Mesorhizobium sp. KR2-14 TaxID=3156610 RepID=UPI0032B37ACD
MEYIYAARIEPDPEGGFLVTFPDVPEAITAGATLIEARANASEALGLALRGYLVLGRPLPAPATKRKGLVEVPVDATTALKLAVVEAFNASGISKSDLARRLGKAEGEARRILDPDHPTKVQALEAALAALGKEIVISVRDAA